MTIFHRWNSLASLGETQHWYSKLGLVSGTGREKLKAMHSWAFDKNLECQVE